MWRFAIEIFINDAIPDLNSYLKIQYSLIVAKEKIVPTADAKLYTGELLINACYPCPISILKIICLSIVRILW